MVYNKLVRDLIPSTIKEEGKASKTRVLKDDAEFLKHLNLKLLEEVQEYLAVKEEIDVLEELADIVEVIHAILAARKLTGMQLEILRRQKAEKRGAFAQRIFLEEVEGDKKSGSKAVINEKISDDEPSEPQPEQE